VGIDISYICKLKEEQNNKELKKSYPEVGGDGIEMK